MDRPLEFDYSKTCEMINIPCFQQSVTDCFYTNASRNCTSEGTYCFSFKVVAKLAPTAPWFIFDFDKLGVSDSKESVEDCIESDSDKMEP